MILGSKGYPISYECSELIKELKRDIEEFVVGKDELLAVWLREYREHGVEVAVNYDFVVDEAMIESSELLEGERIVVMSAECLLDILLKQNDPIEVYNMEKQI